MSAASRREVWRAQHERHPRRKRARHVRAVLRELLTPVYHAHRALWRAASHVEVECPSLIGGAFWWMLPCEVVSVTPSITMQVLKVRIQLSWLARIQERKGSHGGGGENDV